MAVCGVFFAGKPRENPALEELRRAKAPSPARDLGLDALLDSLLAAMER